MSAYNIDGTSHKGRGRSVSSLSRVTLTDGEKAGLLPVTETYAFRSNDYYLKLIDWSDPDDPIRQLVIPNVRELESWGDLDASHESAVTVLRGVQHKYRSTVLLLVTDSCNSLCRYCFRKRLFMEGNNEAHYDINPGLEYIRQHPEVDNVLLTGGDPLTMSATRLEKIISALHRIDHVRTIRIGTKMPAFNPFRILGDDSLLTMFEKYSLPDRRIYMMCHFDHPRELTPQAREAIRLVMSAGVICVNQNPIIRGISDHPRVMSTLWNELSHMGVAQYYVFQGRPTAGNVAYVMPIVEAYRAVEKAKKHCSGLAKRIRYVMSHESGKVEVIGLDQRRIYLKYHQAWHERDHQRLLICRRNDQAYWLDQLEPDRGYENKYHDRNQNYRPCS